MLRSEEHGSRGVGELPTPVRVLHVFNHPNLGGVVTDITNGNFGKTTSQGVPRFFQLGGNLTF